MMNYNFIPHERTKKKHHKSSLKQIILSHHFTIDPFTTPFEITKNNLYIKKIEIVLIHVAFFRCVCCNFD